jgi:hypothetical protein
MDGNGSDALDRLSVIESVRCLECGSIYAKPAGGGTARDNPGCPECGYVGWVSLRTGFTEPVGRSRFFAGRLRRRSALSS